jgi:hypothetical protein
MSENIIENFEENLEILENNENKNNEDNIIPKKKRGRKRKEDLLKIEMEKKRLEEEKNKSKNKVNLEYAKDRSEYKNILLSSFITRWRSINYNHIKDNDNIITEGSRILEEVKKMSDTEYATYYEMFLRNINREDIFEFNNFF